MARERAIAVQPALGADSVTEEHPGAMSRVHRADQDLRHEPSNALAAAIGYTVRLRRRSVRWTEQRDRDALDVIDAGLRLASRLVHDELAARSGGAPTQTGPLTGVHALREDGGVALRPAVRELV